MLNSIQRHNSRWAKSVLSSLLFGSGWAWALLFLLIGLPAPAQQFFNLTANEVRIDTLLPVFTHSVPLGRHYADSVYNVSIEYPEFIPMSDADVARYHQITDTPLPALPMVAQSVSVSRKQGMLHLSLVPLVCRDGQYQKLVSFKLCVSAVPVTARNGAPNRAASNGERYASASVLRTGNWAKIRVPATGIYQLTDALVRQAGFSSLDRVKVYGYGGGMQPERLTADYLSQTDDLQEVPTCTVNGRRLFHAVGPVTWNASHQRVRNPYSTYGYYFLTENDSTALTVSAEEFLSAYYPLADDYCTLYEVDDYAWFHGGRNLYDATELPSGRATTYTVTAAGTGQGTVTVSLSAAITANSSASFSVSVNDSVVGSIAISKTNSYEQMRVNTRTFNVSNLQLSNRISITPGNGSGTTRLDYISIYTPKPKAAPDLSGQSFSTPEYVYRITNQNHHAASAADMVIIIPTSQKLLAQAERLKALHEQYDSLRVQIVPADELFNEFSSGTPDANAYRRYMKMLYDRAETDADMPRFLLLFGDGAWDNRMLASAWQNCSPDDFLLCYESENSYSETDCYVSDDYFGMLDDGEGGNMTNGDKSDVAIGRITARTADEAAIAVDKIESYLSNAEAGAWQNMICFMGDDGNQNMHMQDADSVAKMVEQLYPDFHVKRIMWDAYTRVSSSTGNSYPDVERLVRQQMQQGALLMNYSGHGSATMVSHERVFGLSDFEATTSLRLPLWLTASCDIMPFDGQEDNIGETAIFNKKGGAIGFFGTTRTVYQSYNKLMNIAFTRHVLGLGDDGRAVPIGEAVRQAKNELVTTGIYMGRTYNISTRQWTEVWSTDRTANKLQYTLLGDPALRLPIATAKVVVDSINGTALANGGMLSLKAGATVTVTGRVLDAGGQTDTAFNGVMTAVVRDAREEITCKLNDTSEADDPFVYYDRPNVIFSGSDSVSHGRFSFTFAVPKDISYSDSTALMNLFAVNNEKTVMASGVSSQLVMNGTEAKSNDGLGPSIYCYLNNISFTNGGNVNPTPYFVAELSDEDGINATGSGIGHDLQLIIDGDMSQTYSLNDYFQYDFGSYTSGRVGYSIPTLSYGEHKLLFRAWDVLNNSSTTELTFNVVKSLEPYLVDIDCSPNPATQKTTFRITHDRVDSELDVILDVFDISGRHLWSYGENGVANGNTLTVDWDLTVEGGRRLQTGVYLYRLRIASDGSTYASKAKKLIVLTHK